jgi:hypothetical protein
MSWWWDGLGLGVPGLGLKSISKSFSKTVPKSKLSNFIEKTFSNSSPKDLPGFMPLFTHLNYR